MDVAINNALPNFQAQATSNQLVNLDDFKGKQLVLYFYPKDSTPGCTTEGQGFRDHYAGFQAANTLIFGISRDSLKSHENFRSKQSFPFELISDADEALCQLFGVIKLKKLYGKEYVGIERSTFLIDQSGVLRHEWRGVKVPGHVEAVLDAAKKLHSTVIDPRPI
ncbi:peroxiredoxin [Azomonas macrocytogenes]|uniref:thioredoxin-dependent peroxiredoxin n=1 Tax=Azomonas macrocytogenes TaxID=69962 RepID=A0A839T3Q5_AZOMA|nr:peroxiredoxin [Azomonas macrocytogenes]MBB3103728.1 peroxiredoxin Q/BCP [Azomonas macrocytogenes]